MINPYCTVADFKAFITPPGQVLPVAIADDLFVEDVIERASRRLDNLMGMDRVFYPHIKAYYADIPNGRELWIDDDLLEVITFTNGDATSIASTEYLTRPYNQTPYFALVLKGSSTTTWELDTDGNHEKVLILTGIFGYRQDYTRRGWVSAGTLGAAQSSTTSLTFTMTAGHTLNGRGGQIVKIDNEILNVGATTSTTLTALYRGDNGSTAATHLNGATVYLWQFQDEITAITLEIARMMYKSRYGENVETNAITSAAGVIVTPRSLPVWAQEVISRYRKVV
jgi:hypothetical protein